MDFSSQMLQVLKSLAVALCLLLLAGNLFTSHLNFLMIDPEGVSRLDAQFITEPATPET